MAWQWLLLNLKWKSAGKVNGNSWHIGFRRTRELPECGSWAQVVAPNRGPQAHRAALLDLDYLLLLYWWLLRAAHPPGVADPGGRPGSVRHLQQTVHHARPGHGLLLPYPWCARRARQLPYPDHDRSEGSSLPARQPAQLVSVHHRRHSDDLHDPQWRRRYRLDLLHPP